jgi:hypothetical protein
MRKVSLFKAVVSLLVVATVVLIACSKKDGMNSSFKNEVLSATNPANWSKAHFTACPGVAMENVTQWHFTGGITGLGNATSAKLKIVANITVDPVCTNATSGNVSPGQSKVFSKTIDKTYTIDKNGNLTFDETTTPIYPSDLGKVCPNQDKWILTIAASHLNSYIVYIDGKEVHKTTGGTLCY